MERKKIGQTKPIQTRRIEIAEDPNTEAPQISTPRRAPHPSKGRINPKQIKLNPEATS
jgi:hypothetical protein